jgi:hypothetical protein
MSSNRGYRVVAAKAGTGYSGVSAMTLPRLDQAAYRTGCCEAPMKAEGGANADLQMQQLQMMRFGTQMSSAQMQILLQRFWMDELAKPRYADPRRLIHHGFKVYSQNDEDGIIQEIFKRIGTQDRTFIEFGVSNGNECNTAKLLLEGWRGLWIEGSHALGSFLSEKGSLTLTASMVTAENVNHLFSKAGFEGEIDLLSIDIDYNDYWVWKAINVVRPRVVVIEYNAQLRPPLSVTVPYGANKRWDGTSYYGASLEALVRLGRAKGYRIVGCCFSGVNAFFVREDLCADHFIEPATSEEHYEPTRFFFAAQLGHPSRFGPFVQVD